MDYRRLNEVTKKDTFPLSRIDDLLDQLPHSRFFSSLDLAAGYWQIQVAPDSRSKTAFVTHCGLYEFPSNALWVHQCPSGLSKVGLRGPGRTKPQEMS